MIHPFPRITRITAKGLTALWNSIDSSFRHWDTFVFGKTKPKSKQNLGNVTGKPRKAICKDVECYKKFKSSDRYHWQSIEDRTLKKKKFEGR